MPGRPFRSIKMNEGLLEALWKTVRTWESFNWPAFKAQRSTGINNIIVKTCENSKSSIIHEDFFQPISAGWRSKKDQKWPEEAPTPFNISTKGRITGTVSDTRQQVRAPGAPRHVENVRTRGWCRASGRKAGRQTSTVKSLQWLVVTGLARLGQVKDLKVPKQPNQSNSKWF